MVLDNMLFDRARPIRIKDFHCASARHVAQKRWWCRRRLRTLRHVPWIPQRIPGYWSLRRRCRWWRILPRLGHLNYLDQRRDEQEYLKAGTHRRKRLHLVRVPLFDEQYSMTTSLSLQIPRVLLAAIYNFFVLRKNDDCANSAKTSGQRFLSARYVEKTKRAPSFVL